MDHITHNILLVFRRCIKGPLTDGRTDNPGIFLKDTKQGVGVARQVHCGAQKRPAWFQRTCQYPPSSDWPSWAEEIDDGNEAGTDYCPGNPKAPSYVRNPQWRHLSHYVVEPVGANCRAAPTVCFFSALSSVGYIQRSGRRPMPKAAQRAKKKTTTTTLCACALKPALERFENGEW